MYTNAPNNNSQARFEPGYYTMKAKTKVRQGIDGQANRGILITDGVNEQWVSIPANNEVCRLNFGSKVYYHGHNARPSLTFRQDQANSRNFDNGGVPQTNDPQVLADYYSRKAAEANSYSSQHQSLGDAIDNSVYTQETQQEIEYSNHQNQLGSQQVNSYSTDDTDTIDDSLLETKCVQIANAYTLMRGLLPNVSEESVVKMAISASIAVNKSRENIPY